VRRGRQKRDLTERKDSLLLHRFEALLSFGNFMNLNSEVDDEDGDRIKLAGKFVYPECDWKKGNLVLARPGLRWFRSRRNSPPPPRAYAARSSAVSARERLRKETGSRRVGHNP